MLDLEDEKRTVSKTFHLPIDWNETFKEIAKEMDTTEEHLSKCAIINFIKEFQKDKAKALREKDTAFKRPHEDCSTDGILPEI